MHESPGLPRLEIALSVGRRHMADALSTWEVSGYSPVRAPKGREHERRSER